LPQDICLNFPGFLLLSMTKRMLSLDKHEAKAQPIQNYETATSTNQSEQS